MRVGERLVGVRLDSLDLEAEPLQPLLDDPLRAFLVAEQRYAPGRAERSGR